MRSRWFGIMLTAVLVSAGCQAGATAPASGATATATAVATAPGPSTPEPTGAEPTGVESTAPAASGKIGGNLGESPSPAPTEEPTPASTAIATPQPPSTFRWEAAGTMGTSRAAPHALLLGDGRVLAVGADGAYSYGNVRNDTARTELWDPLTGEWTPAASLNAPRGEFAAVSLPGGGALVVGGLNQSASGKGCDAEDQQAYSSAYVYDPDNEGGSWNKVDLLGTARALPAAVTLADGRVLVAGGYFEDGSAAVPSSGFARAALWTGGARAAGPAFDDVAPSKVIPPLATAEILDPTGTWTATGPMRFARHGAAMVQLADGRVLVVGSAGMEWRKNGEAVSADARAFDTSEIYDPATGRFELSGPLPAIDATAAAAAGFTIPDYAGEASANGSLVALPDGDAVLVGHTISWKYEGAVTRSFRYSGRSGAWSEIGTATWTIVDDPGAPARTSGGVSRLHASVAVLPDGRVLVAGGAPASGEPADVTATAVLYDPATNSWSDLPAMPARRAGAAAVVLGDGSVLLVGGFGGKAPGEVFCDEAGGLATAVRLVAEP